MTKLQQNIINLFFAILLFSLWILPISAVGSFRFNDFPCYYVTAKQILAGKAADAYVIDRQTQEAHRYFAEGDSWVSDPPYALAFTTPLLAAFAPATARLLFTIVLIVLLAFGSIILSNALNLSNRLTLVLIGCMAGCGPLFEIIRISKPIPFFFIGLCMSLFYLEKNKESKAAAFAALCLMKPQDLLPLLAFAAGAKHIRFVGICLLIGLIVVAVTFPVFGEQGYLNYFLFEKYQAEHPEVPGTSAMPILNGQLIRLSVSPKLASLVSYACYGATLVFLFFLGLLRHKTKRWWVPGTIVSLTLGLAVTPYMHLYDLIIAVPAICYLLATLSKKPKSIAFGLTVFSVLLFIQPIYAAIHYYYLVAGNNIINVHFIALLALGVIGVFTIRDSNEEESANTCVKLSASGNTSP